MSTLHEKKGLEVLHDEVIYLAKQEGDSIAEGRQSSTTTAIMSVFCPFANNIHTIGGRNPRGRLQESR